MRCGSCGESFCEYDDVKCNGMVPDEGSGVYIPVYPPSPLGCLCERRVDHEKFAPT